MNLVEKTIAREDIFSGKVFDIHKDTVVLPDNKQAFREVVEHSGGVCIAAIDEKRNIFLVEQYRYPLQAVTLEVVAGKLEKGEDPLEAAIRELSEETGLKADSIKKIGTFHSSPGFCSEKLHFYLATELSQEEQHLDEGEFLNCTKLPLTKVVDMIINDEITDGKTKALVLMVDKILCQR